MGEETTQLDLSAELDRLSATNGGDDSDLALVVHEARFRPDAVDGHELRALCTDGPADLRGRRVGLALHALHRDGVHADRDSISRLLDAVGGPDLTDGYVVDRETGEALVVADPGDPLVLRVAGSSPVGETGDERQVATDRLAAATVAGFSDRARYRHYDACGRRCADAYKN